MKRTILSALGLFAFILALVSAGPKEEGTGETGKADKAPTVSTPAEKASGTATSASEGKATAVGKSPITKKEITPDTPLRYHEDRDKISYVYGTRVGQNFKTMDFKVNLDWFLRGIQDAQAGTTYLLSDGEMRRTMLAHNYTLRKNREQKAQKNLEAGTTFLEANRKKAGVKSLPSGLQYEIMETGRGARPGPTDRVKVHYTGRLLDATEFASTYKTGTPKFCDVHKEIKGWAEALPLMQEGSQWRLFVPPELAYGKKGMVNIPPNATLIYELKLLQVFKRPAKKQEAPPQPQPNKEEAGTP